MHWGCFPVKHIWCSHLQYVPRSWEPIGKGTLSRYFHYFRLNSTSGRHSLTKFMVDCISHFTEFKNINFRVIPVESTDAPEHFQSFDAENEKCYHNLAFCKLNNTRISKKDKVSRWTIKIPLLPWIRLINDQEGAEVPNQSEDGSWCYLVQMHWNRTSQRRVSPTCWNFALSQSKGATFSPMQPGLCRPENSQNHGLI